MNAQPTVEQEEEVSAEATKRSAKRGRFALAAKSPHVSIGCTTEYFITPKKIESEEEETPKGKGKLAAKMSAVNAHIHCACLNKSALSRNVYAAIFS